MAQLAGIRANTLTGLARTWHRGGAAGVDVMHGRWSPPPGALEPGRRVLAAHGRVWASQNRLCLDRHNLELRLGRDELWYLVDVSGEGARLTGPPDRDPARLVASRLGRPRGTEPPRPAGRTEKATVEQLSFL
jgi:hypothetical protein